MHTQANLSSISIFTDTSNVVPLVRPTPVTPNGGASNLATAEDDEGGEDEDDLYATAPKRPHASHAALKDAERVIPTEGVRSWLPVVDASGALKVRRSLAFRLGKQRVLMILSFRGGN